MATLRQALIQTVASLIPPLGALIAERNRLRRELQLVGETDRLTGEGDQPLAGLSMQETRSEVCFQKYIYFGNLFPHQAQYHSDLFVGLALNKPFDKDILHDARQPLPFKDNSIIGFQSEDVFEHLEFDRVKSVFDEIFRCLRPGGLFRLSLPDYNSPLLRSRSVYDCDGFLLCDLAMGGSVRGAMNGGLTVSFTEGGDAHLWFPTYTNVLHLIVSSEIRKCSAISVHHAWLDAKHYVCREFDQRNMPVARTPPCDMRADGKPISIVIDFVK